jgi:hypothetical protein
MGAMIKAVEATDSIAAVMIAQWAVIPTASKTRASSIRS